jgi:hypothetical protein
MSTLAMRPEQLEAVNDALLRKDVELLSEEVKALRKDVESLVAAWNTATYVVVFVKWLAGAGMAIGVIYTFIKHVLEK